MLTKNISVDAGLVNGMIGTVVNFFKENEDEFYDRVDFVVVKFENYKGQNKILEGEEKLVPVKREQAINGRMNFPLIAASSLTIHKSQGSTFDFRVSVDIGDKKNDGIQFCSVFSSKKIRGLSSKGF